MWREQQALVHITLQIEQQKVEAAAAAAAAAAFCAQKPSCQPLCGEERWINPVQEREASPTPPAMRAEKLSLPEVPEGQGPPLVASSSCSTVVSTGVGEDIGEDIGEGNAPNAVTTVEDAPNAVTTVEDAADTVNGTAAAAAAAAATAAAGTTESLCCKEGGFPSQTGTVTEGVSNSDATTTAAAADLQEGAESRVACPYKAITLDPSAADLQEQNGGGNPATAAAVVAVSATAAAVVAVSSRQVTCVHIW